MLYKIAHRVWNIAKWFWLTLIIAFSISLLANIVLMPMSELPRNISKSFLGWLFHPGLNLTITICVIGLFVFTTLPAGIITVIKEHAEGGRETDRQLIPNNIPSLPTHHLQRPHELQVPIEQEPPDKSLRPSNVRSIPEPPEPYVAHPYILTRDFFGRRAELKILDDWAASADTMLIVEAMGGIGKSALTWEWFKNHAKGAIPGLEGAIWWSFYESDATVRNFVRHALAYVTGRSVADFDNIGPVEREALLLKELRTMPYLLVLDGIERILIAYHRLDAPQLTDDQVGQANEAARLRSCTDWKDGEFLQKLTTCVQSKVLISTRLIPHDLQDRNTPNLMPSVRLLRLSGLEPDDALALIRHLGVIGDEYEMKQFMAQFGNHTLLLGVLAGRIINYRPAPGNFEAWYRNEGRALHLTELDIRQKRTHILQYALSGLHPKLRKFLSQLAAFRYPVDYTALSVLNPYLPSRQTLGILKSSKLYTAREKFRNGLIELENRGLLHWDRHTNRYDLHPLVRAYAFEKLKGEERKLTFDLIRDYFQSLPPENLDDVQELGDLRRSLEIYYALMGAGRLEEAADFYGERLRDILRDNLTAYHTMLELLKPLFPDELDRLAAYPLTKQLGNRVADLAYAFYAVGQNKQALILYQVKLKLDLQFKQHSDLCTSLYHYARSLRDDCQMARSLHVREMARDLADAMNDVDNLAISYLNLLSIYRELGPGWWAKADEVYRLFTAKPPAHQTEFYQAHAERYYAQILIYKKQDATEVLRHALELASGKRNKLAQKQILRWQGEATLQEGLLDAAADFFQEAITLTRASGDPSLGQCLGGLARVRALQSQHEEAQRLIEEALEEKYILDVFDLYNSAANVYLAMDEHEEAKKYALEAYKQAWADGQPYSFWWDLERAKGILKELGASEPDMPPFDPTKVRSIPYEDEIQMFISELRALIKPS